MLTKQLISSLDEDTAFELGLLLLRDKFKNDLFSLAKHLLGYDDLTKHTHQDVIDCLQNSSKRKLIVMPRGSFKSSLVTIAYPIWLLINNPNLRILIDSEVYKNSKNFLREIKAHLESTEMIDLFGEFKTQSNWSEGSITIAQRTKPLKESSITCSGIGVSAVGQHFDLIIGDDYNSDKNSITSEGRQKIINHFKMNLSILEPGGTYCIVGTRYAINDVIGHILENDCKEIDPATGRTK